MLVPDVQLGASSSPSAVCSAHHAKLPYSITHLLTHSLTRSLTHSGPHFLSRWQHHAGGVRGERWQGLKCGGCVFKPGVLVRWWLWVVLTTDVDMDHDG
jgi:hypothetical protein